MSNLIGGNRFVGSSDLHSVVEMPQTLILGRHNMHTVHASLALCRQRLHPPVNLACRAGGTHEYSTGITIGLILASSQSGLAEYDSSGWLMLNRLAYLQLDPG